LMAQAAEDPEVLALQPLVILPEEHEDM
jgi:hypothetical protein